MAFYAPVLIPDIAEQVNDAAWLLAVDEHDVNDESALRNAETDMQKQVCYVIYALLCCLFKCN